MRSFILTIVVLFAFFWHLNKAKPFNLKSKFAKEHKCKVINKTHVKDGFAPFKLIRVTCNNIIPGEFEFAKCEKRCRDPAKRRKSAKLNSTYGQDAVVYDKEFKVRENSKTKSRRETMPIACRCIAKIRNTKKSKRD